MHACFRRFSSSVLLFLIILITTATPAAAALISPETTAIPAKINPITSKQALPASTFTVTTPGLLLQPKANFLLNGDSTRYIHFFPGRVTPRNSVLVKSMDPVLPGNMVIKPGITPVQSNPALEEVTWYLTAYGSSDTLQRMLDGTRVSLGFNRFTGKVTGTSGCNLVYASYHAGKGKITISGLGSTKMYCSLPPGVMEQEQRFLDILGQVRDYSLSGHTLTLTTGSGLVLIFVD